jgi:hypothetical protein
VPTFGEAVLPSLTILTLDRGTGCGVLVAVLPGVGSASLALICLQVLTPTSRYDILAVIVSVAPLAKLPVTKFQFHLYTFLLQFQVRSHICIS